MMIARSAENSPKHNDVLFLLSGHDEKLCMLIYTFKTIARNE